MDAGGPFGATLEPAVRSACDGRLSAIQWFRTDWQRGGALTGYATFNGDASCEPHAVVVKLPVPPRERRWLAALQSTGNGEAMCVPRLHAHGESLADYDFAWVVMDRLPHGPLGAAWRGGEFDLLINAIGRFYHAAQTCAIDSVEGPSRQKDWPGILDKARQRVQTRGIASSQRWKAALKRMGRRLDGWAEQWDARCTDHWCHGDLHLGNAMCIAPPPPPEALPENLSEATQEEMNPTPSLGDTFSGGGAKRLVSPEGSAGDTSHDGACCGRLIDLAEVRRGHWVEDAVYLEHLHWGDRHRLGGRKLVSLIAQQRKARGLPVGEDWPQLAEVLRMLLAMSVPAVLHEVHSAHAEAALVVLERGVA